MVISIALCRDVNVFGGGSEMTKHSYEEDGRCRFCGCKRDDPVYPVGVDCPYDIDQMYDEWIKKIGAKT